MFCKFGKSAIVTVIFAFGICFSERGEEKNYIDWQILSTDDTLAVFFHNRRIGTLYYTISIDSTRNKIVVSNRMKISPGKNSSRMISTMEIEEIRTYGFNGKLLCALQKMKSSAGISEWQLAKNKNKQWILNITAGGLQKSFTDIKPAGNLKIQYSIYHAILKGNMKIGQTWKDTVFDLLSMSNIIISTKCVNIPDKDNPNYQFLNRDNKTGIDEHLEIDRNGKVIIQEIPPLYTVKRIKPGGENETSSQGEYSSFEEIIELFKISKEKLPKENEAIVISLKSGAKLHGSVDMFYVLKNKQYILVTSPEHCDSKETIKADINSKDWLSSTVTVQCDNPEIIMLANKIKGKLVDRCEIVREFNNYVYGNIEKRYVASFSNAYETLKSGYGDCGEHAVLLAALLRAVGIESNVMFGLVYMPQKKGYFYHAWVVTAKETILFADPALGKFPASIGYIPLVIDDSGRNIIHLGSLIGRLDISYILNL